MAAVDLRASLKAALLGGPSVLTGESSLIAASCLNGGGGQLQLRGLLSLAAHKVVDKIK